MTCGDQRFFAKDVVSYETYKMRFAEAMADITMEDVRLQGGLAPALRVQVEGLVV